MLPFALGLVFDEETRWSQCAAYLIGSAAAGIQPGSGHRRRSQGRLMRPRGLPGVKLHRFIAFVSDLPYQENETF
ncbi:hypothetical protein MRX96_043967 [Rhipicephalus microplus]